MLDDVERAVDGGINAYKALCRCASEGEAAGGGPAGRASLQCPVVAGTGWGGRGTPTDRRPPAACTAARDARTVAAGGAAEIEVARRLQAFGRRETGLDQYAIMKYAEVRCQW